jgi:16S rRNA (uracil1498-N3)-methyltransferase
MTPPLFYLLGMDPARGSLILTGDAARHAAGSARLRPGERVRVGDGQGTVALCEVRSADRRAGVALQVVDVRRETAPRSVTVVQGVPKGEHADLAVDLLTQTGVSAITPWLSSRCVVDWSGKQADKVQRWRRVAAAAAMQSRRAFVPDVHQAVTGLPVVGGRTFVLHESADGSLFDMDIGGGPLTVVVGPEGGMTDEEVDGLRRAGGVPVTLGAGILRSSLAGAAACVWIRGLESRGRVVT